MEPATARLKRNALWQALEEVDEIDEWVACHPDTRCFPGLFQAARLTNCDPGGHCSMKAPDEATLTPWRINDEETRVGRACLRSAAALHSPRGSRRARFVASDGLQADAGRGNPDDSRWPFPALRCCGCCAVH